MSWVLETHLGVNGTNRDLDSESYQKLSNFRLRSMLIFKVMSITCASPLAGDSQWLVFTARGRKPMYCKIECFSDAPQFSGNLSRPESPEAEPLWFWVLQILWYDMMYVDRLGNNKLRFWGREGFCMGFCDAGSCRYEPQEPRKDCGSPAFWPPRTSSFFGGTDFFFRTARGLHEHLTDDICMYPKSAHQSVEPSAVKEGGRSFGWGSRGWTA